MLTDEQLWAEIYKQAGNKKQALGAPAAPTGLQGRFITALILRLVAFWEKHQSTLIPVLSQLAIAALDAVAQRINEYKALNVPGPQ